MNFYRMRGVKVLVVIMSDYDNLHVHWGWGLLNLCNIQKLNIILLNYIKGTDKKILLTKAYLLRFQGFGIKQVLTNIKLIWNTWTSFSIPNWSTVFWFSFFYYEYPRDLNISMKVKLRMTNKVSENTSVYVPIILLLSAFFQAKCPFSNKSQYNSI